MGFFLARSAWQMDQFPTCWPMNGLFVHWSRGWGVLSFSERLFYYTFTQRSWRVCVLDSPCLSVRLSVCGQNCVHCAFSTVLAALTSYLHILIVHRVLWEIKNLNFGNFFKSSPLTLSCVHLMWLLKVDSSSQLLLQQILMVCDDASKYMFRVWPKLQFCIFGIFFSIVPFH